MILRDDQTIFSIYRMAINSVLPNLNVYLKYFITFGSIKLLKHLEHCEVYVVLTEKTSWQAEIKKAIDNLILDVQVFSYS